MKTMKTILLASVLLSLGACKNNRNDFDAAGTFEATEIIVSSQANGEIMRFEAEEGKKLTAGEEIGYIDTLQLYLKKRQLQASMKSVRSRMSDINKQIAATQEQISTAEKEKARYENLLRQNAGTQKQVDDWDSQLRILRKQLAAQLSTLERGNSGLTEESSATEIQIAQIDDQLRKSRIVSPIDGTVLVKYAEKGELANQGRPLFKIADTENIYLRAYVVASQLTEMKIGQKVSVFADSGKEGRREYKGTISWISDKAEFTPKTIQTRDERANLVYAVKIALKNDGYIKIGMYGEMKTGN